ncbi:hypothetical protein [Rhizobium leguminosarum]|uniref:hypothetical protein n=1 Tax=Rhizobium leguminosarum TaxID=384 RepID=UPI0016220849|nr:hypothetical protein [Rhizobium leguminosarum]MBB4342106.1 hypothetical protein [Rhizobium leguminosarum]MBB6294730.1 hypothetical protein [Rhizobium leguminosarum]
MSRAIEISPIELMALKKLALINGALAKTLTGTASRETSALLSVLLDVINRADLANATGGAA